MELPVLVSGRNKHKKPNKKSRTEQPNNMQMMGTSRSLTFCTDFIKYVNRDKTWTREKQKIPFPSTLQCFRRARDCVWAWVNAMFKKAAQWPTRGERSSVSHISLIKKAEEKTIWAGRVVTAVLKSARQLHKVHYKKGIVTPPSISLSPSQHRPGRVQHYSPKKRTTSLTLLSRQTQTH